MQTSGQVGAVSATSAWVRKKLHNGPLVSVTSLPGVLAFREELQKDLAKQRNQPHLIKPESRCPKCKEKLYQMNPHAEAQYDTWLIHRCMWCGRDLHLP